MPDPSVRSAWFCGIDPGFNGGITFVHTVTRDVVSQPMPVFGNMAKWKRLDIETIKRLFATYKPFGVCIEKVGAMPKQGVSSMFTFGYNAGILEGIVTTLGVPLKFCTPHAWMKDILRGIPKAGGKPSIIYAKQNYPQVDWRGTERSRVPHDGKTDSLCIALHGLSEYSRLTEGASRSQG